MKKLTVIITAVAIGFVMTSCGNKEKDLMNKANELYAQAETELNAIGNWDGFVTFFQSFKQKFDDFKAGYSNLKLSQETQDFLSKKKEAFDQMESQKAGELFAPILVKGEQFAKTFTDFSLLYLMNYPHRLHVGKGFCYAAWRHEPVGCSMHPAEQGMSTMPLSHWLTFGNTFLKMFAAPFMSAFVIVPS